MRKPIFSIFFLVFLALFSCNPVYRTQSVQYQTYRISPDQASDPGVAAIMQPYSDSVNKRMNEVVGYAEKSLDKKAPESTLGNFMADVMLIMATEKFGTKVDAGFVNFGGIRLTQLAKGPVTRGKVFELMPFDNILVLQQVKGDALQQFLDLTAGRGGWPLAGLTMQIKDKKAVNVVIGGRPLDPNATYTIANSDFVANGGDNADMLKVLPQQNRGYLVRDAIFDYIRKLKSQGKNIDAFEENRVTNAQ
jgi:2',3'-cyclic-nucleotide 2'-phosphodiesterase (5'-nucleotidase family)